MGSSSIVYLMYHELELPGRRPCQPEPGYVRYVVSRSDFQRQIRSLREEGRRGLSVSEALTHPGAPSVSITFDDACETDLIAAAPLLGDAGFGATFYVTVGFLGKPGFMKPAQVRELADLGFEVGCHSMTHSYLTDLDGQGLHQEIAEAKDRLEQMTGRPIRHFSCPGGRWDERVAAVARQAGYQSVATSRNSANSAATDPFCLGRVAVMRDTSLDQFQRICRGHGFWRRQVLQATRGTARALMGNAGYDRLRSLVLTRGRSVGTTAH